MIFTVNPALIVEPIDEKFFFVFNPLIANGGLVISRIEHDVLQATDGNSGIAQIARRAGLAVVTTGKILEQLTVKEIVASNGKFSRPSFDRLPESLSIWLHTTNRCTLTCSYCHVWQDTRDLGVDDIDLLTERLLSTAAARSLKRVKLRVAGGEPLMLFDSLVEPLSRLQDRLQAAGVKVFIGFISNLTVLKDSTIKTLKEKKWSISVSLDGLGQYHDASRFFPNGTGSFNITWKNIDRLLEAGISPFALLVISNRNAAGLPALTTKLLEHNIGSRFAMVRGEALDYQLVEETLRQSYALIERRLDLGQTYMHRHQFANIALTHPVTQACGTGRNSFSLFVDGQVHACQSIQHDHPPIGDLRAAESSDLIGLLDRDLQYKHLAQNSCADCRYEFVCAGDCPLFKVDGRSPHCEMFKNILPIVFRLWGKELLLRTRKNLRQSLAA